jgi:hypothetical protein
MSDYSTSNKFQREGVKVETFQGIHSILQSAPPGSTKKITLGANEKPLLFPYYSSPQRTVAQAICGWGFERKEVLDAAISKLELEAQFERAAAIAIFHYDNKRAISTLTKADSKGFCFFFFFKFFWD